MEQPVRSRRPGIREKEGEKPSPARTAGEKERGKRKKGERLALGSFEIPGRSEENDPAIPSCGPKKKRKREGTV